MTETSQIDDNNPATINEEVSVGEDLAFQRAWWKFERIIWRLFVLIIALDLAGAFGRGPLANARVASADRSFVVTYERIQRAGTPSLMSIHLQDSAIHDGTVQLTVSDSIVSELGAQRVIPQPEATVVGTHGLTYTFPAHSSGTVRLELRPNGAGVYRYQINTQTGDSVSAKIWVVP